MAITKEKKIEAVKMMADMLKKAKSAVFYSFKGFSVKDTTQFRRKLRESQVGCLVAKKTLMKIALKDAGVTGELPELKGEIGLACSEDLIAPAREVYGFQKKFKDSLSIVGGIFEGKFMSKEEMMSIALIPPVKTLQAQFVNVINSPIQGFVVALSKIAEKKQ